jgi:protein-L-isoaspartate(D-aspartate) O-methyltransferase
LASCQERGDFATDDPVGLHAIFADDLARRGAFGGPLVEAAFRAVPRHRFLPGVAPAEAYRDQVIVTKVEDGVPVSASSQPSFMAVMLQQLGLQPGHRVLEIGTGTGYNAALMAEIVGGHGKVVSVDIDAEVVAGARACLGATGYGGVTVLCADGTFGHPPEAPYDRIVVTVGAGDIPPALREQLRPGGCLVVPLSIRGPQRSIAFRRVSDVLVGISIADCDLSTSGRGEFAGHVTRTSIGGDRRLWLWCDGPRPIDPGALERFASGASREVPTGRAATIGQIFGGLYLWLALHDPRFVQLGSIAGAQAPWVLGLPGKLRLTAGLLDSASLCVLGTGATTPATSFADDRQLPLFVRASGDPALTTTLIDLVRAWDDRGRPGTSDLSVLSYPATGDHSASATDFVIEKRWSRLVLSW